MRPAPGAIMSTSNCIGCSSGNDFKCMTFSRAMLTRRAVADKSFCTELWWPPRIATMPASARLASTHRNFLEANQRRHHRHRLVRRHPRRDLRGAPAGQRACTWPRCGPSASLKSLKRRRPTTATADYRSLCITRDRRRDDLGHAGERRTFPWRAMPACGQARVPREADCDGAARGRRAHRDRAQECAQFTIGYSQRFNPKFAYVQMRSADGTHRQAGQRDGQPAYQPHLGKKISGRVKLSPAAMEATHDLDFVLWCLEPASRSASTRRNYGAMHAAAAADVPDTQCIIVTMDAAFRSWSRGLEPAASVSEFFDHLDRVRWHRRRGDGRRHAIATSC